MDFEKINIEFSNMQKTIIKYNEMFNNINQKIKLNDKNISKYDTKIKNTKVILEKDIYRLLLDSLKSENNFLKQLIGNEVKSEDGNTRKQQNA